MDELSYDIPFFPLLLVFSFLDVFFFQILLTCLFILISLFPPTSLSANIWSSLVVWSYLRMRFSLSIWWVLLHWKSPPILISIGVFPWAGHFLLEKKAPDFCLWVWAWLLEFWELYQAGVSITQFSDIPLPSSVLGAL